MILRIVISNILLLPGLVMVLGLSQNLFIGVFINIFIIISYAILFPKDIKISYKVITCILLLLCSVSLFHLLLIHTNTIFGDNKSIIHIFFATLFILSAAILANFLKQFDDNKLDHFVLRLTVTTNILVSFFMITKINFNDSFLHELFFFIEPSHYFVIFAPFNLYVLISSKIRLQFIFLISLILQVVLFQSMIGSLFIFFAIFIILFTFDLRKRIFISICLFGIFVLMQNQFYSLLRHIQSRSFFIENDLMPNITVVSYLSGVERSWNYFLMSPIYGIGLGQFGHIPVKSTYQDILKFFNLGDMNKFDGGVFATTIIAELGLIGLLIVIYISYLSIKSILRILKKNVFINIKGKIFFVNCILACSFFELFVRGMGIFSPGMFIITVAIIYQASIFSKG